MLPIEQYKSNSNQKYTNQCLGCSTGAPPTSYCIRNHLFSYIYTAGRVAEGSCLCTAEQTSSDKDYIVQRSRESILVERFGKINEYR